MGKSINTVGLSLVWLVDPHEDSIVGVFIAYVENG